MPRMSLCLILLHPAEIQPPGIVSRPQPCFEVDFFLQDLSRTESAGCWKIAKNPNGYSFFGARIVYGIPHDLLGRCGVQRGSGCSSGRPSTYGFSIDFIGSLIFLFLCT